MDLSKLPEPIKVHPLIKLFRWTFLIVGTIYGARRKTKLERQEKIRKEVNAALKKIKEQQLQNENTILKRIQKR